MGKYDMLFKHIELLSGEDFGKWFSDKDNYGSMERPIQMPYFEYSQVVENFVTDVRLCWEKSGLQDYLQVLRSHNIEWGSQSMSNADISVLPSEVVLALLFGATRSEKSCDGALLGFLKNGNIQKWLKSIKEKAETENKMRIILDNLLRIPDSESHIVKIRFNQHDGNDDPMDLYLRNPDIINSQWLFWRNKQRFFNVGQIAICLMKISNDEWLLTTIKRVTQELNVTNGVNYIGEELQEYSHYFGRVKIKYHRTSQTQGVFYNTVRNELEVLEILPNIFDGDEFPGYDKVRLSYTQLKSIIDRKKKSWVAALENQKAVYLITDKNNGKLYVGSATSEKGMLLSRWMNYADSGHGGNVELKKLVNEKGLEYVKNYFQYSILENYNAKVDDHIILERESWWKETLQSRRFGYNYN